MLEKINQRNSYQINGSGSVFSQDNYSKDKDSFGNVKDTARKDSAKADIAALRGDILKSREDRVTHDFADYDHKSFLA